jgi:hypothetical protein
MKGQFIFVEIRSVTKKNGQGEFRVIKLVSPSDYSSFEAILSSEVAIPTDVKRGSVVDVTLNLSQQGYRLSAVVEEVKAVA